MEKIIIKNCFPAARVDVAELLIRLDDDRELLRDLIGIFRENFPRQSDALQAAVARGDMKETAVLSHTLKGMLANLSVTRAATAAAQLERVAQAGENGMVPEALAAFELEVQGLLAEMETYMAEVQP